MRQWADKLVELDSKYLEHLEAVPWSDCQSAQAALLAAESSAMAYVDATRQLNGEIEAHSSCKPAFNESLKADARAEDIIKRMQALQVAATNADAMCAETPGWTSSYSNALSALAVK